MYQILFKEDLAPKVHLYKISAPSVARKAAAGQFIIIRIDEKGERIPLTIVDWDDKEGSVTVVVMEVGATTSRLAGLGTGDFIADFVGPLGLRTHVEDFGHVVCVAGGFAVATIYPIARAMRAQGNRVTAIMGARNKELLFWEDRLKSVSDNVIVTTDDGTYGRKALVTELLKELCQTDKSIKRVIAIGPSNMMKFCSLTTQSFGIKTIVSLNPIMVDGTGMCGCCRVLVGGATRFVCVDGPDFDGHQVDWELLLARQRSYLDEEKRALEECNCARKGGIV